LIDVASEEVTSIDPQLVDVRGNDDQFLLMELELVEPSLYFRCDAGAATRFAAAFDRNFQDHQSGS